MSEVPVLQAATPPMIEALIARARARLVVLAPAVSIDAAKVIAAQWRELGRDRVSVTLDVDPEVCRLGYGDLAGLELLERTGASIGGLLQRHAGIRIGVIVSDDTVLVFSPIPALIEAGPRSSDAPNAVLLDAAPPALVDALGVGSRGVVAQEIGLDKATREDIEAVSEDLRANPPQRFDIARRLLVFNAAFQFIQLEMTGTNMSRRTVTIPNHLIGVTDAATREQLRTVLTIVPPGHELSGRDLERMRHRLVTRYLKLIPRFGQVILRADKEAFTADVAKLSASVAKFKEDVRAKLSAEIEKRVEALATALMPGIKAAPPNDWLLPLDSRDRDAAMLTCLREDLRHAIGSADEFCGEMKVSVTYKDVTFESLRDRAFLDAARAALPNVPQLHAEFEAAGPV